MNTLTRALVTVAAAAALTTGLSSAAQADDYSRLNAAQLEQTVLRAQMPKTMGSWTQNYYFTIKDRASTRPTMCWGRNGDVNLPAADILGGVGYAVDANTSGSVSVFQYGSAAKAKAALDAMKKAPCADYPVVMTDAGQKVKGNSGSDFTDASMSGYVAYLDYQQDGKTLMTEVRTTQRGLAVVQTTVFKAIPASTSDAQQQKLLGRMSSMNKTWHKSAVRAYESFGQGESR